MSYKNQREAKADYDFIEVAGPSTFKEIDSLFQEYCKDFSRKDKISPAPSKQPQHLNVGSRSSLIRPSTAKLSDISTPSTNKRKNIWNPATIARLHEKTTPYAHKGIEFEEDVIGKLHSTTNKSNGNALNILDDEINQLAQEFGINLAVLASIQSPEKRHEYVIECMRRRVKDDLKDFNKRHNARMNNILHFETEFQKIKEKQQKDSSDIFGWLNVNTPHEPLKKKLRSKLVETIHDYENLSKIETSLEELKKSKDSTMFSSSKKIQLDNVPHVDNFEIMQGILAGHSDNLLKMTKSMKHASRKNEDSQQTNPNESTLHNKKLNETHAPADKEAEVNTTKQWDSNRERIFRYYREDAKGRLFNDIKSSNWNELGFSPHVQAAQKDEKSKQQRDTKLANYMNGDLLTPEDYKLLANTSITLNKFVDKKYLQTVVNHLDPEIISAIETDLAEKTLKDHQKRQKEAREARLKFLKDCTKEIVDEVNARHQKAMKRAKMMAGAEERRNIKQRAVSLLNRFAERKNWKSPPPRVEDPDQDNEPVDINHFASKFLKVVNKSVQSRKNKKSQEFLQRFMPLHPEEKPYEIKELRHFCHPSSKLLVTSENHAKDYMGLGTEYLDPTLAERKNGSPDDYKLSIHSPQKFKVAQDFKKYYSGGPVEEEERGIAQMMYNPRRREFLDKVATKIQAAWRRYQERKPFKLAKEKLDEKNRSTNRMEHLKKHTTSNFLKTVLLANDRSKNPLPKKQKHTTIYIDASKHAHVSNPGLNSNPKRLETVGSYTKINYDSKLFTLNDTDKGRASNLIDIPRMGGHQNDGRINSAKSITSVDLNAKEDEIRNLKAIEAVDAFRSPKGVPRRPQTALIKSPSSASNGPGRKLELQKQTSVHKQLADQWQGHTSDEESPDEARKNKIAQRAPPKGLLLKQRKLFTAAKNDNFKMIQSSGYNYYEADVNSKDDQGNTPLYYAAKKGNKEICEFLVTHKARVNEPCKDGDTPLHMAFASGEVMVVILLISYGGNLNVLNDAGQTAIAFGSESLLALLDLKNAVATFNRPIYSKALPSDMDNNRFLSRFQQNKDLHQDYLSFNYAPLKQNMGRVGSARRAKLNTDKDHDEYLD